MRSPGTGPADRASRRVRTVSARSPVPAVALTVLLTGCGVRIDGPPPALPSPSPAETMRQAAAERAEELIALAEAAAPLAPADEEVLERVAGDSRDHLVALGGLWEPPEWATPSPRASTGTIAEGSPTDGRSAGPSAGPVMEPAEVVRALAEAADAACADATGAEPADLAAVLASICLAQRRSVAELRGSTPELPGAGQPEEEREQVLFSALAGVPDAADLALALDSAGFALEVAAARAEPGTRSALAARAAWHREAAELLVQATGSVGTAADPRLAAYALGGAAVDTGEVEADVLSAWSAVVGDVRGDAREAVLLEMSRADDAARSWGAPHDPLPGLAS